MKPPEFFHANELVAVMTTQPLGRALDYKAPEGGCHMGAFVEVPLGPRKVIGVVWGAGQGDYDLSRIRSVIRVLDAAPMREELRSFLTRAAAYTLTPMPAMLRLATRAPGLGDPPSMRKIYRRGEGEPDRMTDARRRVLETLAEYGDLSFTLKELAEMSGVTASVIKGLVTQGAVLEQDSPRDLPFMRMDPSLPSKELTEDQASASALLAAGVASGTYGTTLLRGVTGSGKTEVYLEAVAECIAQGRQALVLLPEVALTAGDIRAERLQLVSAPSWLRASEAGTFNGYGTWTVTVDRAALSEEFYQDQLVFSNGDRQLVVPVTVYNPVAGARSTGIGQVLVQFVRAGTAIVVHEEYALADANYRFEFGSDNVPDGRYIVRASSDLDGDNAFCEAGELCGSLPLGQEITVKNGEKVAFEIALQLK